MLIKSFNLTNLTNLINQNNLTNLNQLPKFNDVTNLNSTKNNRHRAVATFQVT